jgi:hypothetical protein
MDPDPCTRHVPTDPTAQLADQSAVSIHPFRPALQFRRSGKAVDPAFYRRRGVAPKRDSGLAGMENRPAVGGLCPLDYGLYCGGGIMGCSDIFIAGRIIHNYSRIFPPKRLIFPNIYPQKIARFLQKSAFFSQFIHILSGVIHSPGKSKSTIFVGNANRHFNSPRGNPILNADNLSVDML